MFWPVGGLRAMPHRDGHTCAHMHARSTRDVGTASGMQASVRCRRGAPLRHSQRQPPRRQAVSLSWPWDSYCLQQVLFANLEVVYTTLDLRVPRDRR